ncbi:MAG: PA0069 family radical SAM protein [Candidatus Coatesbacteria bacterium]
MVPEAPPPVPGKGRGAGSNPTNRFERIAYEPDPEVDPAEASAPRTRFYRDRSRSVLSFNDSPDIGYDASLNPYRGCEHGCIYCYARPTHEYLGFSSGLDFETRIMVKEDAPALLRAALAHPKWEPQTIALSGVTDCYQPVERRLRLTRQCLEVLAEFRNPVGITTKNALVTRDLDLLGELARHRCVSVTISITSLDLALQQALEPRTSPPFKRLEAVRILAAAGIPVGINVAPVIPALNEHEMGPILKAAAEAGAQWAGHQVVRLPHAVKDLFAEWLTTHFPDRAKKVLNRIRSVHGGKLNDARFGVRMSGQGIFAEEIHAMFAIACKRAGMESRRVELSTAAFRRPSLAVPGQLSLFE